MWGRVVAVVIGAFALTGWLAGEGGSLAVGAQGSPFASLAAVGSASPPATVTWKGSVQASEPSSSGSAQWLYSWSFTWAGTMDDLLHRSFPHFDGAGSVTGSYTWSDSGKLLCAGTYSLAPTSPALTFQVRQQPTPGSSEPNLTFDFATPGGDGHNPLTESDPSCFFDTNRFPSGVAPSGGTFNFPSPTWDPRKGPKSFDYSTQGSGSSLKSTIMVSGRLRLPVVLVTGLRDSHPGVMPDGDCASAGSMATLCQALKDSGFPVYVPSSSADPAANTIITNSKGFDSNAQALKAYLSTVVGRPALLVGHSMGGIFSRIALADGAEAAGLFTIGSPFDGSFAADLADGAANFACRGIGCVALRLAGAAVQRDFGLEGMRDLTSAARNIENLRLNPPGVKTWTFAGTACHPSGAAGAGSYLFPNDGVVGKSSAYGATANLGATMRSSGDDYHQGLLGTLLSPVCGSGGVELTDQSVVNQVLAAANQLDNEQGSASVDRSARAGIASAKPKRVVVHLQTATVGLVKPGSKLSLDAGTSLLSKTEFALSCDGRKLLALPALGDRVFGFPPGGLSCRRATLSVGHPVRLGIATDLDHVTATIGSPRSHELTVTVSAKREITRLVLSHGGRAVRTKQRRLNRRALQITLTPAQAAGLTLTATIEHRKYTTTIS